MQYSKQYSEEVVKVADLTLSECSIVLARQRRDYWIDQELFAPQYPVFDQAPSMDDTCLNNKACERIWGEVDYRLTNWKI